LTAHRHFSSTAGDETIALLGTYTESNYHWYPSGEPVLMNEAGGEGFYERGNEISRGFFEVLLDIFIILIFCETTKEEWRLR
jgi:hypothetical protein